MSIITTSGNIYDVPASSKTGYEAADFICQYEGDGRFGKGRHWKAWLSTSTQNAGTAVYQKDKNYIGVSGEVIAPPGKLLSALTDDVLVNSVSTGGKLVWTGTNPVTGRVIGNTCNDWTSASAADSGVFG